MRRNGRRCSLEVAAGYAYLVVEPERPRIGRRARAEIARGRNELWLAPVSVWELLLLAERGRAKLGEDPSQRVSEAATRTPAQEAPLNFDVAIRSRQIMLSHPDPADRFLAATASIYDLTLVTADARLVDARACRVLPN